MTTATGYNAASDALVDALCAIATTEVNAAVNPSIADTNPDRYVAIRKVRTAPLPLGHVPNAGLPSLSVYVTRDEMIRMGPRFSDSIVTVTFDWFSTGAGPVDLDARWKLARQVWLALVIAVRRGVHDNGSGAIDVLTPAGVVRHVTEAHEQADYRLLDTDALCYPGFTGRMQFQQRIDQPDTSALALFTDLRAWIDKFNGSTDPPTEESHHLVGARVSM